MASLANVTKEIRIIFKILGFASITLVMLYVFFVSGVFIKETFFPTPAPPPERGFGDLPEIEFPEQSPADYTYIVNTTSGKLPVFPDRITVYKTRMEEPSLVALQEARGNASDIGFTQNETKVNDQIYHWTNRQGDRIEINIITGDFEILSNYTNNAPPSTITGSIAEDEGAYEFVIDFLNDFGTNTSDFSFENSVFTYQRLEQGQLVEVESRSQAQFVKVDLFQDSIEEYRIYYPGFTNSTMYFVMLNSGGLPRIVEAKFYHSIPDLENGSTYPIKTSKSAFQDLQNGNAIYASSEPDGSTIDITNVTLGYYLGQEKQPYLLPVVRFEGVGFVGYVKAIQDSLEQLEAQ